MKEPIAINDSLFKPFVVCIFLACFISFLSSQEKFRRTPPYPDPLPQLRLGDIESGVLSNGLTVSVVRRENLPLLCVHLLVLSGESASPISLPGLSTFAARMMRKGSARLSSSEIEESIDSTGGDFKTSTTPDYTLFAFSFLEEHLEKALSLLSEMILRPLFSRREITNSKRTLFYELATKNTDPEFLGKKILYKLLLHEHPYSGITFNNDIIKNYTRDDLLSLYDKFYRPNNAHLIFIGNISLTTALRLTSRYFYSWEKKEMEYRLINSPSSPEKLRICFVDLPGAQDIILYAGTPFPPRSNDDFFPLLVLNQLFGGTQVSRLFMNLRESKGYAYWAYSQIEFFKACEIFSVKARVTPESIFASVSEILSEISKVHSQRIPTFEVEMAKSYLIGNFPLNLETCDDLASRVSEIKAFNLSSKHWDKYYESIMYVDTQMVFEAVRKTPLVSPIVVIVGDLDTHISSLAEFDKIEIFDTKGNYKYSMAKEKEKENETG